MDRLFHFICEELNNLIPPRSVRDHSRATDLIQRDRHIKATPFLGTFVFGTAQTNGSVSAVRDYYKTFTGDDVAYSSIQQWITPELADLLLNLVNYVSVEFGAFLKLRETMGSQFVAGPETGTDLERPGTEHTFPIPG